MTGKELIEKLQLGIINSLNETGVTNGDGHYVEDCLTCAIGVVLLKAGYNSKQIVRYFTRAALLLESGKEVDFTKEITNFRKNENLCINTIEGISCNAPEKG